MRINLVAALAGMMILTPMMATAQSLADPEAQVQHGCDFLGAYLPTLSGDATVAGSINPDYAGEPGIPMEELIEIFNQGPATAAGDRFDPNWSNAIAGLSPLDYDRFWRFLQYDGQIYCPAGQLSGVNFQSADAYYAAERRMVEGQAGSLQGVERFGFSKPYTFDEGRSILMRETYSYTPKDPNALPRGLVAYSIYRKTGDGWERAANVIVHRLG